MMVFLGLFLGTALRMVAQNGMPAVVSGPVLNPANGHQYYLLGLSTWEDAEARAVQLGGHLVTLNDAAENLWVYAQFGYGPVGTRSLWIGLRDPLRQPTPGLTPADRAGRFVWVSGEPVTYVNWWPGRPNNDGPGGNGTGTQYWGYLRPDLLWDDVDNALDFIQGVVEVVPGGLPDTRVYGWAVGYLTRPLYPPFGTAGAVAVGAGQQSVAALRADGKVLVWPTSQPQPPAGLGPVAEISVGAYHAVARLRDGTVAAWGNGQIVGNATKVPAGLAGIVAGAAGNFRSLAVDAAGKLTVWGTAPAGIPPSAAQLAGTVALAAGEYDTFALKVDGSLLAWGNGGGSTLPAGLPPLRSIRAEGSHAVAVGRDGKVYSWGNFGDERYKPPNFVGSVTAAAGGGMNLVVFANGGADSWPESGSDYGLTRDLPPLKNPLDLAVAPGGEFAFAVAPPFPGDDRAGAIRVAGSHLAVNGDNSAASRESGESDHGTSPGGASRWWEWSAPASGLVSITLNSSSHQMEVYRSGGSVGTRTPDNQGRFFPISFTVQTGNRILIAVEGLMGVTEGNRPFEGPFGFNLDVTPPPDNDRFERRQALGSTGAIAVDGTLTGAGRESGEPTVGAGGYPATVWYDWTAPATTGTEGTWTTVSVTGNEEVLPDLEVYAGSALPELSSVPGDRRVVGFTRQIGFLARAGTPYRIAVAGRDFDGSGLVFNETYGRFRLGLVSAPLAIRGFDVAVTTNKTDRTSRITGTVTVQNFGSRTSGPVRLQLYQRPGYAFRNGITSPSLAPAQSPALVSVSLGNTGLGPGEFRTAAVSLPLPPSDGGSIVWNEANGYGGFAVLEEQAARKAPGALWRAVDRKLLGTGLWPTFSGLSNAGPGGGAIRVDPGVYLAGLDLVQLTGVRVNGPDQLRGGARTNLTAAGHWSDGVDESIEPLWEVSPPATISPTGLLDTGAVMATQELVVRATYSSGGFDVVGEKRVTVTVTPLRWGSVVRVGTGFGLGLSGEPGRRVRLERSTDLASWSGSTEFLLPAAGTLAVPLVPTAGSTAEFYRAVLIP